MGGFFYKKFLIVSAEKNHIKKLNYLHIVSHHFLKQENPQKRFVPVGLTLFAYIPPNYIVDNKY